MQPRVYSRFCPTSVPSVIRPGLRTRQIRLIRQVAVHESVADGSVGGSPLRRDSPPTPMLANTCTPSGLGSGKARMQAAGYIGAAFQCDEQCERWLVTRSGARLTESPD